MQILFFLSLLYLLVFTACTGGEKTLRQKLAGIRGLRPPQDAVTNPFDLPDSASRILQQEHYTTLVLVVDKLDKSFRTANIRRVEFKPGTNKPILSFHLTSQSRYSSSTATREKREKKELREVIQPFLDMARPLIQEELVHVQSVQIISCYRFRNYLKQNDRLQEESAEFVADSLPLRKN